MNNSNKDQKDENPDSCTPEELAAYEKRCFLAQIFLFLWILLTFGLIFISKDWFCILVVPLIFIGCLIAKIIAGKDPEDDGSDGEYGTGHV